MIPIRDNDLSAVLRAINGALGITQAEMAQGLLMGKSAAWEMLHGKRPMSRRKIFFIEKYYGSIINNCGHSGLRKLFREAMQEHKQEIAC